jgi:hypothetical protein
MSVESILTGALCVIKVYFSNRRRVLEHLNVTYKASTANIVGKDWFENEAWGDMGKVLTSRSVAFKGIKE